MSSRLADLDHKHLWHPFTQAREWEATPPLVVDRAEDWWLIDEEGRRFLDGVGSLWVGVHGHRHPKVDAAIRAQLDKVAHSTLLGLTHPPAIELAARLGALIPGLPRVFYSDSGSTAVEVALKMAFQWQQQAGDPRRTRFASLQEAYHGDTLGAVSVGGIDLFHEVYRPLLFPVTHLPNPRNREDEAELARRAIEALPDDLAAIIVEPLVQGAAGMRMHSAAYLRPLLQAARDRGALVIIDEVATGFGRTGTLLATEQLDFTPDFICLGKGLTNGYLPLAATLTSERVYEGFRGPHRHTFFHGHTFTGNPLGCAAAIASLDLFAEEGTLERGRALAERLAVGLEELAGHPSVLEVRRTGLMVGIDIGPFDPLHRTGHRLCAAAREAGVILRPLGDTLVLMPPVGMPPELAERMIAAIGVGLSAVAG